jgi:hypothetical protein
MGDQTVRLVHNHWNLFCDIAKLCQQVFRGRARQRQVEEDRLHRIGPQDLQRRSEAIRGKQLKFIAAVRFRESI